VPIAQAHRPMIYELAKDPKTEGILREILSPVNSRLNQKHMLIGPTPDYMFSPLDALPYLAVEKKARLLAKLGVAGVKEVYRYLMGDVTDPKVRASVERKLHKLVEQGITTAFDLEKPKKNRRYRSKDDDFRRRK
jgi:hypothetical protein